VQGNGVGNKRRRAHKKTQRPQERRRIIIRPQGTPRDTKRVQERARESKREREREREGGETRCFKKDEGSKKDDVS